MKKRIFLILAAAGQVALAQTPRLSLYEEFTGETCPPCAATNPALNALLLTPGNQQKIVAIKWQVPIPSAPTKTWSLYQTNKAEIDWRHKGWNGGYGNSTISPPTASGYGYPSQNTSTAAITSGVNSAPSGRIDGQHQWVFGANSDHPGHLNQSAINTAQSYTSAFSVVMTRAWNSTYSAVDLTVSITASANFTAVGNLVFRTVMVEREISFEEQPGTNGEKFFEDVAVKSFPDIQNGTALPASWTTSQNFTFTLNCPLPSYIRDKAQVAFVGFIQDDGDRKVAQTVRADVDPLPNDAKAITAAFPAVTCSASITPDLVVKNVGTNAITALTITPYLDGVVQPDFYYAGTINAGATSSISLNPVSPAAPGGHLMNFSITGVSGGDVNVLNNAAKKDFYLATSFPTGSPVVQTFSLSAFPQIGYHVINADAGASWSRHATANGTSMPGGLGALKYDFYNNPNTGDKDEFLLPPVGFSGSIVPKLTFDVAYCQYQSELDKLEVLISDDCGATWSTVYSKQGSVLSTKVPQTAAFIPNNTNWRPETVLLPNYANSDVIVKFVTTADYGNNLYIDNINLSQTCTQQTISVAATGTMVCIGEPVQLTATGGTLYSWSTGQTGSAITIPTFSAGTTMYVVKSTDAGSCGDSTTVSITVNNCVDIKEAAKAALILFPNPSNGEFTVQYGGAAEGTLTLYNQLGQQVAEFPVFPGSQQIKTDLANGLYLYTLSAHNHAANRGSVIIE